MGLLHGFPLFISIFLPLVSEEFSILLFFVLILPGIVFVIIWCRTGYTISGETLVIVYGMFRIRISIMDIKKAEYMTSPFTGPALSVQRVGITYGHYKTITVSPKDKEAFVQALRDVNPDLVIA
ncbi:PH domain-containing protein [Fictibacillus macauensis]|nr:PH domain-containing protein [Fictibacillus macauensis]